MLKIFDCLKAGACATIAVKVSTLAPTSEESNRFEFMYDPPYIDNIHVAPWGTTNEDRVPRLTVEVKLRPDLLQLPLCFITPRPGPESGEKVEMIRCIEEVSVPGRH